MRKLTFFLAVIMLCGLIKPSQAQAMYAPPATMEIHSEAVYLVNLDTGKVVYEKNAHQHMVPASLVKIMTAILALEHTTNLDAENITAPNYIFDLVYGLGAATADIRHGEVLSMRKLLYAIMLQSAAEGALIIADYVVGTSVPQSRRIAAFVEMMNDKAKEIGALNTNFTNPHGLYDEDMYTTAYDMYLISKYAMSLPNFMDIASTAQITVGPTNKHDNTWRLITTNVSMLKSSNYYYEPIRGIKTGTLDEGGRCLITTAQKDGYNYLLVLMGAPIVYTAGGRWNTEVRYDAEDAKKIYEWAFGSLKQRTLVDEGKPVAEVGLRLSFERDFIRLASVESFSDLIPNEYYGTSAIQFICDVPESIDAPVVKGTQIGYLRIVMAGVEIGVVPLVAAESIARSDLLYSLDVARGVMSNFWFKFGLVFAVVAALAYLTAVALRRRGMNRAHKKSKKNF